MPYHPGDEEIAMLGRGRKGLLAQIPLVRCVQQGKGARRLYKGGVPGACLLHRVVCAVPMGWLPTEGAVMVCVPLWQDIRVEIGKNVPACTIGARRRS